MEKEKKEKGIAHRKPNEANTKWKSRDESSPVTSEIK
jgi:hypothetical protein